MKHFKAYLLCLGLALITVSCSQDDFGNGDSDSENLVEMSFIAGSSQPITRTVLGSDGATVTWQANDKIGIGFKSPSAKNYLFTTPTSGSDVHFWGKAPNVNNVSYFMMYPYQQDAKISANSNTQAIYQYNFPKEQNAIAGTFDPKANVSVGIIPQRGKPFIAYNVGGLLRFTIKGTSNVKQVKLLAIGQENLAGNLKSTITFATDGKISAVKNEFTAASPVVNLKAESGTLEENKTYYIALPEQKLSQGLTLVFIMQDGKAILKKVKQEINIQRAKVYDLGEMTLDASKAKAFILKNQGLIEAVATKVSGLIRTADGHLDIYAADNLEKILSYKGMLEVNNKDNFTSIDELQYYRNINGLNLQGNKNLAGELNLNKYPQLTGQIVISGSPLVTKINVTGLDKITQLQAHHLDGMTEVVTGGNTKLNLFAVYNNNSLQSVDASNMPALTTLQTYYSPNIQTINTTNSPNLNDFNGLSNGSLQSFIGLSDNSKLQRFWASGSKIESYDFSKMTNLSNVNLASAAVKEIKGLSAAGANLKELQLSNTHVGSLDVSNNPNLTKLDLYNVREMTTLDVTHNPNLIYLRTTFIPFTSLDLSNNTKLEELSIAHCRFSSFDIRHIPNLAKFYAGSQSPNGFLANITVTMTAAQKAKLEQVKPFKESANDDRANHDDTNSWVKVVVVP
ncbi:fimbrillin family protein [Prevotella jejuni]|uniref:fimbrillin family protein n=1 Tax=Prevotella jejuni TaxID=1177574 RepID=UPI003211AF4E